MIDGGMVRSLTGILQVIDLDNPDAPKIVNLLLKALESSSRAANARMDIMREEMEEGGGLRNTDQIEMTFHVENEVDDDMGDEDDDMGDADHDDTGLGDDYNDEMIDEEDDDFHENRVIEPFEAVNVDDLFGLREPLGFDRRCRVAVLPLSDSSRSKWISTSSSSRPSRSWDPVSMWSSGGHSSGDLEALSFGSFDVAPFNMFDAPVLSYEHDNQPSGDPLSNDGQVVVDGDNTNGRQAEHQQENGNEVIHYQPNPTVDPRSSFNGAGEGLQMDEPMWTFHFRKITRIFAIERCSTMPWACRFSRRIVKLETKLQFNSTNGIFILLAPLSLVYHVDELLVLPNAILSEVLEKDNYPISSD
ncbi:unnamed protein product [Dovyalis caffra]|uniref:Uncharacterized protein n=1 Tax=Dovyalis caffra TaxID=77055 RepID=A0AAV1QRU1_9ROSI|nr:unnamed protein product [Dovyalis caffra]